MKKRVIAALVGALASPAMAAAGQTGTSPPQDVPHDTGAPRTFGHHALTRHTPPGTYLDAASLPDTTKVLPPPPLPGSPEQADDDATFARSRTLLGSPRWLLATRDAALSGPAILADFGCAMGVVIDPARVPALARLLAQAGADMSPEIDRTKQLWGRKRPFIGNDQPVCVAKSPGLVNSPSYPSGHTTLLFGTALILAELAPDRAAQIMQRGRTLSESRIICGVHWLSDVQSGFIEAATLVAALHGSAAFRADLEQARSELDALRHGGGGAAPTMGACQVEQDAAAHSPLFRLQPATP